MNQKLNRWIAVAALAVATAVPLVTPAVRAQDAAAAPASKPQGPTLSQLETQAFRAFRIGKFEQGDQLLAKAAEQSRNPQLAEMHRWTSDFEDQLKVFVGERQKAYQKAVDDVQLLIKSGHEDDALNFASVARSLTDDKKAFHDLPWMRTLITDAIRNAAEDERTDHWLKAMRLYSDLAAVEPASKDWKEKLKLVVRRVRLLASYAPDVYKGILEHDVADADAVRAVLDPTTKPTTRPADALVQNENFKVDWHDTLRGVDRPMLVNAMHDAYTNYYRDTNYKGLTEGGLNGVEAILTTPGLEQAFPALSDAGKRAAFTKAITNWRAAAAEATADDGQDVIDKLLSDDDDGMLAVNSRTLQLPPEVLLSEFADGALGGLDPFTSMIWPADMAEFNKATQGNFSGIGVQIEVQPGGDLKVVEPLPDSPAERAGLRPDDVIVRINGKSAKGITTDQAVRSITGPAGTMVRLGVRSSDLQVHDYNIRRERIKVASVKGYIQTGNGKWDYYIDPASKIAYIRILQFSSTTIRELRAAIDSMGDGCNGIILDLRGNPGGLLQQAIAVCDEFLRDGVIVSTHPDRDTPNGPTVATAKDDKDEFNKPLVVLVNQLSASASEIVSGALKDDHRAILVGERTFGKGSVQQLFPLDGGNAMIKLTTAHYYLPSGRCIHREENSTEWGVDPDVTIEMTPEQMRVAQSTRRGMDVYRDANAAPAEGLDQKLKDVAPAVQDAQKGATTQPSENAKPTEKDLLKTDPQLAAALLVLRLEVAGARL